MQPLEFAPSHAHIHTHRNRQTWKHTNISTHRHTHTHTHTHSKHRSVCRYKVVERKKADHSLLYEQLKQIGFTRLFSLCVCQVCQIEKQQKDQLACVTHTHRNRNIHTHTHM